MAIDYEAIRAKLSDVAVLHVCLIDQIKVMESGKACGIVLPPAQLNEMEVKLKDTAMDLRSVAQEIKVLSG